jgi:hypothetical protein
MTLRNNDTQNMKLSRKTVQRFAFILNLVGAGDVATVALDLINVKCILTRSGSEYVLFHENLQLLSMEANFFGGFTHAFKKDSLVISDTARIIPLMLDLGSPVNLSADDELNIEVTTKSGWYGTFDAGQSSVDVEYREAIGIEIAIPFIKTKAIQATNSRVVESLGDNVTSIMLLNVEANRSNSEADKVWESLILISDKWSVSDNRGRLLARRATQFETVGAAASRGENFRYVPNAELDALQITIELRGTNVVATKNYIVYRTFLPTAVTSIRSQRMKNKHQERNVAKLQNQIG